MVQTDVDVCNLAIGIVGGEPIDELGEDSPLGAFCQLNYPQKRDFLLGAYRWTFANKIAQLSQLATTPADCPRQYAYEMPGDVIGAIFDFRSQADSRGALPCGRPVIVNGIIASDTTPLFGEYTAQVKEDTWPTWFVELVKTAFAAEVAGGPGMNRALANDMKLMAFGDPREDGDGGLMLAAKQADARQAPQRQAFPTWDDGPLVGVRGGGFWGHLPGELGPLTFIDF